MKLLTTLFLLQPVFITSGWSFVTIDDTNDNINKQNTPHYQQNNPFETHGDYHQETYLENFLEDGPATNHYIHQPPLENVRQDNPNEITNNHHTQQKTHIQSFPQDHPYQNEQHTQHILHDKPHKILKSHHTQQKLHKHNILHDDPYPYQIPPSHYDKNAYLQNIQPAPSLPPNPHTLPNPFRLKHDVEDLSYPFTKHTDFPRTSRHRQRINLPPFVDQLPPGPFIDRERSGNITALVGRLANLNCRVNQIGNRTVSWLRDRDTHLLTVGRYTYTSDQRFRAQHITGSEDWPLTIEYAQVRDTGIYECQVSSTPPIRHYIFLNVVEPRTRILGGPDVYINRGSSINLTCVVDYTPDPPAYVIWKHNGKVISYDSQRGGVSVMTEKGPRTSSNLIVRGAAAADSGTFSCSPSTAPAAAVTVHILNGEHPEAMQHGGHSPQELSFCLLTSAVMVVAAALTMLT